jgi:IclR family acetate operon transcriptional repressor
MDDLALRSRPVCEQLADAVRETVDLVVRDGAAVITIAQVIGAPTITSVNWVGRRNPLHAISVGKVFLAHMGTGQLEFLLAEGLES